MQAALHEYNPNDSYVADRHRVRREHARQPAAVRGVPRVAGLLHHRPPARSASRSATAQAQPIDAAAYLAEHPGRRRPEYGWPMADLLDISSRIIDSGVVDQTVNRVTNELSELADDLAIVESFSHCVAFDSGDGLVCFDCVGCAHRRGGGRSLEGLATDRVSHLVYTHGHADHVGGSTYFAADSPTCRRSSQRRRPARSVRLHEQLEPHHQRPTVRRHTRRAEPVDRRGRRWRPGRHRATRAGSCRAPRCDRPRRSTRTTPCTSATRTIELHHARGETDDHLWAWLPDRKWIMARRLRDLELPQRRQPAEGAALSGRNGRRRYAR